MTLRGDPAASPSAKLKYVALLFLVPALGVSYVSVSRAGDGDVTRAAALVVFAIGFAVVFFGDMLPEIPDRLISGLLSGFAASAGIGLVILSRLWRKRGF